MGSPEEVEWITVSPASKILFLSESRTRQLVDAGKIRSVRIANIRMLDRRAVEQLAQERRPR